LEGVGDKVELEEASMDTDIVGVALRVAVIVGESVALIDLVCVRVEVGV